MVCYTNSLPENVGPAELVPPGLPLDRQWYLYQKIREHCAQDTTCIKPANPTAANPTATTSHDETLPTVVAEQSTSVSAQPPSTRKG